jgi:ABC-type polysaccharide/polyol phosphate transport system ATPase subunit
LADSELLRLDGVWKRHRRYTRRANSLKQALIHAVQRRRPQYEEFWALRDVSFAVRRGESVGFCGSNGAGKSTLLRIIARITEATHGSTVVRGRVAAMLELGTGFLPEISGRDNIRFNAALLGLSNVEVDARMQEIIEFAELGAFIDSPVSTYSSGMYMRLGFAVASHVDADILIIDEVFAVGDEVFQQKCVERLGDLRRGGTSVLIVSHELSALSRMTDRVLWMDQGGVRDSGDAKRVVEAYHSAMHAGAGVEVSRA